MARVSVSKGLPFGFDIGGFYSYATNSNVKAYGADLRYAILDGGTLTPALGLRAAFSNLEGVLMFASFVNFFEKNLAEKQGETDPQHALRLAVAALCVEMARADMQEKPDELERARQMLAQRFSLTDADAQALIAAGRSQSDQSVSLYHFTHLLNDHLDAVKKRTLLEMLWRVAYEDGVLDKYEDALMHKLAELLYVPLVDLIRAKDRVLAEK